MGCGNFPTTTRSGLPAGKIEVLAGLLQEKYGNTREQTVAEIDKLIAEYESKLK